jgi:hypothetical protein
VPSSWAAAELDVLAELEDAGLAVARDGDSAVLAALTGFWLAGALEDILPGLEPIAG